MKVDATVAAKVVVAAVVAMANVVPSGVLSVEASAQAQNAAVNAAVSAMVPTVASAMRSARVVVPSVHRKRAQKVKARAKVSDQSAASVQAIAARIAQMPSRKSMKCVLSAVIGQSARTAPSVQKVAAAHAPSVVSASSAMTKAVSPRPWQP